MIDFLRTKADRFSPKQFFTGLIRIYQVCISPLFGPSCRFYPTCSAYAIMAIKQFGVTKGVYLAAYRLIRCQPLCKGGVDFPPEEFSWKPVRTKETTPSKTVEQLSV